MRCKKHMYDVSSTVGVCASCLRDRLILLIEKQSESPIQFQSISNNTNPNPNPTFNRRLNQQPPPLVFPRSVSPYISRRKSEPIQRFYTTPQVNINPPKKKLGLISRIFRSRSITSSSSNSTMNSHNSTLNSHNSAVLNCQNKGMSPENELESEIDERETESSPATWMTRPSPARVRPSPARAASFAFCLSPLVRASPSRNWRGEKLGFSGEIRVTAAGKCNGKNESSNSNNNKPHLSIAASFCANRSRKLADFGRLNLNR